jgi:hypothetical protein
LTFGEFTREGTGNAEYGFVNVTPGEYEVHGQFSTRASFDIQFGRNSSTVPGGIVPSSIRSLEGPVLRLSTTTPGCGVQYARPDGGNTPASYRVAFTVTGSSSQNTC